MSTKKNVQYCPSTGGAHQKTSKIKRSDVGGVVPYTYQRSDFVFSHNESMSPGCKSSRILCNNCGKSGHLFHQCKMPIMSIGIIVFRVVPDISHKFEYLIIRRKETLGYIDFMRGKYSIQNKYYILNMLKQMTNKEKQQLKCKDFNLLWKNIWGSSANHNQYKSEESNSREKYYTLLQGVKLHNDYYNLDNLIESSSAYQLWEEPEWGFPKGRRNNQENDFNCAIREFSEETGYSVDKLVFLQNVAPYEEIFTGSNYKSYKHKYFLMYMDYKDTLEVGQYQTSEVSMMAWKSFDECIQHFRPYNLEKIRILKKVDEGLNKMIR
jgi:ADP-ribose pyrophosphatase YjhB (NUDIX family)